MSEPLSAERLRELHRRCSDCYADYCEFDHDEWPCDIIMALDSLETENARLRERAGALAKALAEVFREVVEAALRAYREGRDE